MKAIPDLHWRKNDLYVRLLSGIIRKIDRAIHHKEGSIEMTLDDGLSYLYCKSDHELMTSAEAVTARMELKFKSS